MDKPKDLCGRCAAMLREGFDLKRVAGGVDHKVTCAHCGRRQRDDHRGDQRHGIQGFRRLGADQQ